MNQQHEFQDKKLFAPIEELKLDRRAYHMLKRADINYVSDIITCGEKGISNLRNMGPLLTSRVFLAAAKYLDVPRETLIGNEIMQVASLTPEKPFKPLDASITALDLPFSITRSLNAIGVFQIEDLLKLKVEVNKDYRIGNLQYGEVRKIYRKLGQYLANIDQVDESQTNEIKPVVNSLAINLSIILKLLMVNERSIQVVKLRAIRMLTLEEIAVEAGGVTRERIRQIIDQIDEKLRKNINLLMAICDYFETRAKGIRKKIENNRLTMPILIDQLKQQLIDSNFIATDDELELMIAVLRLLVINDKPWSHEILQKRWVGITFLACLVDPPIKKHKEVDQLVRRDKEKNKKLSYKELAYLILSDAKEPLHWLEIAERVYRIGHHRGTFSSTALYNVLMSHPNVFVRVDAGTYALLEWGYSQAEYYPDIIASILKSEKRPIPLETINIRVDQTRKIRQSTLIMLLSMHPRFYKSRENTYGLRIWLPPREKQTLRTPEWLVEDADSFKRLEQARQRGYDVDSMIKLDLSL